MDDPTALVSDPTLTDGINQMPWNTAASSGGTFQVFPKDTDTLQRWIRMPTAPQRLVLRSRIVLLLAAGLSARAVSRELGVSRHTVDLWRRRYLQEGSESLRRDRPGRGRKPSVAGGGR